MYKLFQDHKPITVYNKMLVTFINEHRCPNPKFTTSNKRSIGFNSLHNRFSEVSNLVRFDWTRMSYHAFKMRTKDLFFKFN